MGYNWGTTGEYVVVSKDILTRLSLLPMQGTRLTQVFCDVLAITPDERAGVEALAQDLTETYRGWATEHLQREQPGGDVLAKYSLPADPEFSGSLSNHLTLGVMTLLGEERGSYFLYYGHSWLLAMGMYGGGSRTLTVFRQQQGDQARLLFRVQSPTILLTSRVSPSNPFPEAFLPLFPNGW
ncbi:MAG: hypothetical protein NT154_21330, partial [Verrucomicrobia bacterium]|nr:hypothetical protein [Verrucomicrobiota bacterium]